MNAEHNLFIVNINEIALILHNDKRKQSNNSIKIYTYGTNEVVLSEKNKTKCSNIIRQYKND